jgi:hypothetical protein
MGILIIFSGKKLAESGGGKICRTRGTELLK